ncbi:MAG: HDOD domain-containing protein [Candidatus Eisenbacteria bacterium]|uniref:HDOD domain-containing protein n=1 Tax=Eiseniibacteriota bacterium TaxID=2212470 RepID=A0A933SDQ5_UNCEI|nr:HDOD domain-containing protein [Candidatus Eisenbacteria bacterium]
MFKLPWDKSSSRNRSVPPTGPNLPAPETASAGADPAQFAPGTRTIYSARQPILDRQQEVFGYELLFRSGPENRFTATDPELASAVSIEQNATAIGLDRLVGDRRAFVNLSRGALLAEYHRILPRERAVIELLENIPADPEVMEACRRVKADGYMLALDDFTNAPESYPFLDVVDLVKVDLRLWKDALDPRALEPLKQRGVKLLAEKVETIEEKNAALRAGYDLLQGYYFQKPQMIETRDLPPSKLSVLRFLAETSRDDASMERLEELFRQDVGLTMRLLRYLNSAAFGWRHEVSSIGHALALMGISPLRKWAMMMGMMSLCDDRPHELMVTALSRARFSERLAPPSGLAQHEHELFLTGMLSMVDTMVGRPADEILGGLSVSPTVREAVLAGSEPLGPVLKLVTAYERGDWDTVDEMRRDTEYAQVDDEQLDRAYVDSVEWAEATAA